MRLEKQCEWKRGSEIRRSKIMATVERAPLDGPEPTMRPALTCNLRDIRPLVIGVAEIPAARNLIPLFPPPGNSCHEALGPPLDDGYQLLSELILNGISPLGESDPQGPFGTLSAASSIAASFLRRRCDYPLHDLATPQ